MTSNIERAAKILLDNFAGLPARGITAEDYLDGFEKFLQEARPPKNGQTVMVITPSKDSPH
jgi:hypothetical protein